MDMDMDDMEWRGASPLPLFSPGFSFFPRAHALFSSPRSNYFWRFACLYSSAGLVFLSVGFFNACLDKQLGHNALFALALFFSLFHSYPFIAQSTLLYSTRLDSNTPFSHSYSHSLTLTLDSHSHRHSHSSFSLIVVFRLLLIPFAFVSPCNHPRLYASNSFFRSFI